MILRNFNMLRQCCLLAFIAFCAAFPAETPAKTKNITDSSQNKTMNTRTAPFEDKKQFLSQVLDHQKKKPTNLKTPSHFMNPDKYEFYTFDDDGQIVKKLMSVQEIQRIIANNERGQPHQPINPIEYYQVITVSPDVEPPPAVSRINPNEPLFSIHDVIASVQNVLKSEISLKRGQGASSAKPSKKNSTTSNPIMEVESEAATEPSVISTTFKVISHDGDSSKVSFAESKPKPSKGTQLAATATEAVETLGRSTEETATAASDVQSVPLSLADAHPGFISNETYLEPQASVIQELPQTTTTPAATTTVLSTTEAIFSTETSENTSIPETKISEGTINQLQIPMNQDLAESVSSLLSQIASEISINQFDGSLLTTETVPNAEDEDNSKKKAETIDVNQIYITTKLPDTTTLIPTTIAELEKSDNLEQSASVNLQNVFQSQNKPRPFQKNNEEIITTTKDEEFTTTSVYETTTNSEFTYLPRFETESPDLRIEAKDDVILLTESEGTTTVEPLKHTVSPAVVDVSEEHVKPVPDKVAAASEIVNQTIEGVQIVMESNIGKIPRPTETPGEVVKDTERSESTTEPDGVKTTEPFTEAITEKVEVTTQTIETTFETVKPEGENRQEHTVSVEEVEPRTEAPEGENLDGAESKISPESQASEESEKTPDNQGTLKQNNPYKPFFSKPQKPVYIKPTKTKTPVETKPTKPNGSKPARDPAKDAETKRPYENHFHSSPSSIELEAAPAENLGLEATTENLDKDVKQFTDLCNELAFSLWSSVTHSGLSFVRSIVVSPFAVTSLLAMVFLGARGPTSGQMNDVLKLDEMVTFNPHLVFRNVTESLVISRNPGVATAAFVRELYSDKSKGKLLDFYKERAQQFYDGHVEEVNFKTIGDTLRRQTNHLVKRQTWGKITDFLRGSNLQLRSPLAAFSANIFQTDCTKASTKDRDGEMYFVILPATRLRRLVPVPAVVWRDNFLAGYEPGLDATAVAINPPETAVSTIFVLPGQQGLIAPGDSLARLEHHLLGSAYRKGHWARLMKSLLPRPGLELQIPRLSHRSVINVTASLQRMGLRDLFSADKADLTGLNGIANDLHLSDMLQVNLFSTCGEDGIGPRHISEVYPATPLLRREKSSDTIFSDTIENLFAVSDFEDPAISAMPLELRPRQARIPLSKPGARIPEPPRLRFDRPFLFFVRHNPTGLILHIGRFNPRLTT